MSKRKILILQGDYAPEEIAKFLLYATCFLRLAIASRWMLYAARNSAVSFGPPVNKPASCTKVESAISTGTKRIILVAPTGAGKTIIASAIIKSAVNTGKRVLVLSHRREIIKQTSQKLYENGIEHGIIQAGFATRLDQPVQVASVATLWTRGVRLKKMDLPPADVFIIDVCHHSPAQTYRKIIDAYPDAVLIGLTATPCRGDGRGLGGIFESIIECPQVAELIDQKFLVPTVVYAPSVPDLKGVTT